jgi:hypothetical protein
VGSLKDLLTKEKREKASKAHKLGEGGVLGEDHVGVLGQDVLSLDGHHYPNQLFSSSLGGAAAQAPI